MKSNRYFIKSTVLEGRLPIMIAGSPAVTTYQSTIDEIERLCGAEAASLFAEPVLPRGPAGITAMSWYCAYDGAPIEVASLDEIARKPVEARLEQQILALRPALADAKIGPIVSSWLTVGSSLDVLAVGGQPVLVNWGARPESASSPDLVLAHRDDTIGRFLSPQARRELGWLAAGAEADRGGSSGAVSPEPSAQRSGNAQPARASVRTSQSAASGSPAWLAPLIASAIAAGALVVLLLPGVLVYPSNAGKAQAAFEADRLKASNDSLEAQLKTLQYASTSRVCRAPGETVPVPGLQPLPADNGGQPSPPRMELIPRPPDKASLPPAADGAPGVSSVASLLERSTVLVFALKPPDGVSQGTGFFINARQIVTNHHVVAGVEPKFVFVASQAIGGARRARILHKTQPPPSEHDLRTDFAVLEIDPAPGIVPLKLGTTPAKLSTAYVAGFPGFLTQRDAAFQDLVRKLSDKLHEGDLDEALRGANLTVPGTDLRYGRINNIMTTGSNALQVIIHDMQLAPGNSGGPLVDACGRLGGVNTLLFKSDKGGQQGNVAQDVSLLKAFLSEHGLSFVADDARCEAATAPSLVEKK